jgi:poly(3-hydroxybutyrate) depolymerase
MSSSHLRAAVAIAGAAAALCVTACSASTPGTTSTPASTQSSARTTRTVQSASLGTYKINTADIMVAGLSSGAFMAVQLQYAYSKTFKGSAIFAGGPYFCAEDNEDLALTQCTDDDPAIPLGVIEQDFNNAAAFGYDNATSNLKGQKSYLFSGLDDTTVYQSVMKALNTEDEHYSIATTTNFTTAAGHGWVTPDVSTSCSTTASPYLINCGFDAEQTFLTLLYGSLNARNNGTLTGSLIEFNQNPFVAGGVAATYSMDSNGWLYVPAACASGTTCKLLVALHGCAQSYTSVGNAFVAESGLNEWADTNDLIVLYPQAIPTSYNPYGCWDWWGYTGSDYSATEGIQMEAVDGMVQHLI